MSLTLLASSQRGANKCKAFSVNDHAVIHMCNWGTFVAEIRFDEENFLQTCTVISISLYNVAPQELVNCENWSLGETRHVEMVDDIRAQGVGSGRLKLHNSWDLHRSCYQALRTSFPSSIHLPSYPNHLTLFFSLYFPSPPPPSVLHKTFPLKLVIDFVWESFLYNDCPLVHIFSRDFDKLPSDRLLGPALGSARNAAV
jgi:hypothetical protein